MQFRLPHFFRPQVLDALLAEAPEVVDGLLDAGALLTPVNPLIPDFAGFRVRRSIFERFLRSVAITETGVAMVIGHAEQVEVAGSRVAGVVVDGRTLEEALVIDASGRIGRFTDSFARLPLVGFPGSLTCRASTSFARELSRAPQRCARLGWRL